MPYNLSVHEYPDGSIQIRKYDEIIGQEKTKTLPEYEIEPFTNTKVRKIENLQNREDSIQSSLGRTRRTVMEITRSYNWQWWVTLTFDPKKIDRTDFKQCSSRIRNWLANIRKRKCPDLVYLAVPELHHKNEKLYGKTWHFHLLMANCEGLQIEKSGIYKKTGKAIYNIKDWNNGFSTAIQIEKKSNGRLSNYISKYITKDLIALSKGCQRYYISKSLPKPKKTSLLIKPDQLEEAIKNIADSFGKEIVYINQKIGGYVDVTYYELE